MRSAVLHAAAFAALVAAAPAPAATLELDFTAYGGGLRIAEGTLRLNADGTTSGPYQIRLDAGWASWITLFTSFRYEAEAAGTLGNPSVKPARFKSERRLRRKHDVMRMDYAGAVPAVRTEPPRDPHDATLVPEEAKRGTADPLSVGAAVIAAAGSRAACTGRYPVYDGRRRYDLLMTPLGREILEPSSRRTAAGPADVCLVTLRPVAGFQNDHNPERFFVNGVDRTAKVWFARVGPQGRAVPVQMEVETNVGTFYVHTTGVRVTP
ncbi:MAG TPA: DUF3108 domain-containing protein [Azospirillum sp.]|nr:DUF3108 domain-containing protein [Azospirillum sp.]